MCFCWHYVAALAVVAINAATSRWYEGVLAQCMGWGGQEQYPAPIGGWEINAPVCPGIRSVGVHVHPSLAQLEILGFMSPQGNLPNQDGVSQWLSLPTNP